MSSASEQIIQICLRVCMFILSQCIQPQWGSACIFIYSNTNQTLRTLFIDFGQNEQREAYQNGAESGFELAQQS